MGGAEEYIGEKYIDEHCQRTIVVWEIEVQGDRVWGSPKIGHL